MKIAILGAASARAPLVLTAIVKRQKRLGLTDLALMDLDGERLDLIGSVTARHEIGAAFKINNPNATSSCGCGTSFSV